MITKQTIITELKKLQDTDKAKLSASFFKTAPGEYGENDMFIGVTVPQQRAISEKYVSEISLAEIEKLLNESIHEYRLTALFLLVSKFEKAKSKSEQESVVATYLDNICCVNNWDLVDSSAHKILGPYYFDKDKQLLYDFVASGDLWKQRVAILTTFHFIKYKQFDDSLKIAKLLIHHHHDLIHKAIGWMLREIGKIDYDVEYAFLKDHYTLMPRTMLRYAI